MYKQGRRHFAAHLTVFFVKRDGEDLPRVGFAVGCALGGAVERNRIKRRLREAIRMHMPATLAADLVIHPKKAAMKADFSVLSAEINRALQVAHRAVADSRTEPRA